MTTTELRALFKKYIRHVGAAECDWFARDVNLAPCGMGEHEFTEQEKAELLALFAELDREDGE